MFFNKKKTAIKAIAKSLENLSQANPHYKEVAELIEKTRCDLLIAAGLFEQKRDAMIATILSSEKEIEDLKTKVINLKNDVTILNVELDLKRQIKEKYLPETQE